MTETFYGQAILNTIPHLLIKYTYYGKHIKCIWCGKVFWSHQDLGHLDTVDLLTQHNKDNYLIKIQVCNNE